MANSKKRERKKNAGRIASAELLEKRRGWSPSQSWAKRFLPGPKGLLCYSISYGVPCVYIAFFFFASKCPDVKSLLWPLIFFFFFLFSLILVCMVFCFCAIFFLSFFFFFDVAILCFVFGLLPSLLINFEKFRTLVIVCFWFNFYSKRWSLFIRKKLKYIGILFKWKIFSFEMDFEKRLLNIKIESKIKKN